MNLSPCSEGPAPKQITAAELREYLHLPAKDVAKELGMCLTSLKKVCRQHGILRWPYRRLKMIDRKIQSLEQNLHESGEDQEDTRRQLEKLHNERAQLPCSYGSCGLLEDGDSNPSSPLSCASTTVTQDAFPLSSEEGADMDFDFAGSSSPIEDDALEIGQPTPPANANEPIGCAVTAGSTPAPTPMTAAAALISSLPSTPRPTLPPAHTSSKAATARAGLAGAHKKPCAGVGEGAAVQSCKGMEEDGSMRVELSLSAELASEVARGAQLVVHHANGKATVQIIPVANSTGPPAPAQHLVLNLPQTAHVQPKQEAQVEEVVSDEDMISALVGCAEEKASRELGERRDDGGELELGLHNHHFHHHQLLLEGHEEEEEEDCVGAEPLSDEALALALAGCVRADGRAEGEEEEERAEEGCEFTVGCEGGEWYADQGEQQDLDMSLFEQDA